MFSWQVAHADVLDAQTPVPVDGHAPLTQALRTFNSEPPVELASLAQADAVVPMSSHSRIW